MVNYYSKRFDDLQASGDPNQITLNYEANATKFSQFRIYNSPVPEGVAWHNITIVMSAFNGSKEFNSGNMQFFYKNQAGYQITRWDYDFNFSDCHVIEMKLRYSEVYAPVAGFFVTVHQVVKSNHDFSCFKNH